MKADTVATKSSDWYERLILLYPPAYLRRHRAELLQNFTDLQRDSGSRQHFFTLIITDFLTSLTEEYMNYIKRHRWAQIAAVALIAAIGLGGWQLTTLHKAHSTFENYYAFRGCQQLLSRTDTAGTCRLASGKIIKLVQVKGKWYLAGDLPLFH